MTDKPIPGAGDGVGLFSTGQVAKLCRVAPRTAANWIDTGMLRGYRIPGSKDRRVPRAALLQFLREHNLAEALARLEPPPPGVLLAGLPPALEQRLHELLLPRATLRVCRDLFALGLALHDAPEAAVVDLALGSRDEVRRAVLRLVEDCKRVVVVLPEDVPVEVLRLVFEGDGAAVLGHPVRAEDVAALVLGCPVAALEAAEERKGVAG